MTGNLELMLGAIQLANMAYAFAAADVHIQWSERIEQQLCTHVAPGDLLSRERRVPVCVLSCVCVCGCFGV